MLGAHKKRAIKARVSQSKIEAPGENPVVRGLAPVRLRSSRKTCKCGVPDAMGLQILGPLRDPAGASPLATMTGQTGNPR
jgi:hypothetical protein